MHVKEFLIDIFPHYTFSPPVQVGPGLHSTLNPFSMQG